jgi:arylformamidase
MEEGAQYNVSRIARGVHTGIHIDAPFHIIPDGITAERWPLETLISGGA